MRRASVLVLLLLGVAACAGGGSGDHPDGGTSDASPNPQCSDGIDNDGDGKIDYPNDPGCFSKLQNDETDGCPDANCPECGNGIDDDGDGQIDYPDDSGCISASDLREATPDPAACTGVSFMELPDSGTVNDALTGAGSSQLSSPTCGGAGIEKVYEVYVPHDSMLVASTDFSGTAIDTVVYVRSTCTDAATELGCDDDASASSHGSTVAVIAPRGFYYVVVDGKNAAALGAFQLTVSLEPGPGNTCDPQNPTACSTGLVCRTVPGAPGPTCELPICHDGVDNDGDGKIDFPLDPGCASFDDADETDSCPDGADCPACGNGRDDDGDQHTDYPADPDCASASDNSEGCGQEHDPILVMSGGTQTGDTTPLHDDFALDCADSTLSPDQVVLFTLPVPVDSLSVDTLGSSFDTVLAVDDASCGGELGCNDDGPVDFTSEVDLGAEPAGTYAAVVDGYSGELGTYDLNLHGVVAAGAACTDPLFASGNLTCPTTAPCDGAICRPPACSDGVDNDHDGKADYPADPGCQSPTDDDETDDCPSGPNCPQCSNGSDDDGDNLVDYPTDPNCVSASDNVEGCEADATITLGVPVNVGTTIGAHPDFTEDCGFLSDQSPDRTYLLTLPEAVTTLTIDTTGSGYDTVLAVKSPACDPTVSDFCNDNDTGSTTDSRLVLSTVAAGSYIVVVDGTSGAAGAYNLNVRGFVAAGAACTDPLFATGVLACPAGQTCQAGSCAP